MLKKKFSHSFCVRHRRPLKVLNSDNLQYNKLVCWVAGTNDSLTKHLMFQALFSFNNFSLNSLQKSFQSIFLYFYNFTKIKIVLLSVRSL